MKKISLVLILTLLVSFVFAESVKKTYNFSAPEINHDNGFQTISFSNSLLTGITGEPTLPYFAVSLLLPPGEVATSIKFIGEDELTIEGTFKLFPYQSSKPLSDPFQSELQLNEQIYSSNIIYPQESTGGLSTGYLNGYSIAMSTFTPIKYNPLAGTITYFQKVTIIIETATSDNVCNSLSKITPSENIKHSLFNFIQNPENESLYVSNKHRSDNAYNLLIVTPEQFVDGFSDLRDIYLSRGLKSEVYTSEYISANISGQDLQEKIRNFIIQEYQESGIEYVILGGDVEHIPYRGFYCYVQSGGGYTSNDIPADLYYSALDGSWNDDGDDKWGEPEEDDLLPDIAVARYPFSTTTQLARIINKSINYQNNPVLGEFTNPLLAGEHLYSDPATWGRDYLDLLIGERNDNGYTTIGIPETYPIDSLYEHDAAWSGSDLINEINTGHQFIHHVGHASPSYVAHLNNSDITNSNFYAVNGSDHNFTLLQTHGCDCGSFDNNDCILEKMVTIDNFAVSVIGNSRYGWFNEGQSEGPAAHLHREMVDAMYTDLINHLGSAFVESKIQTAPWVEAPGQHEEGALRWNFYDINILGDPVLSVWTNEPIDIDVDYPTELTIGTASMDVNVTSNSQSMENFTCSVMKEGILHATGQTDASGNVTLVFDPLVTTIGDATLITVGYNCLPDTNYISFIPADGAYVIYNDHEVLDPDGNNNGMADFGETIILSVELINAGVEDANDVQSTLSVVDTYISLTDDSEQYGAIASGDSVTKSDAFSFDVAADVPDQHTTYFTILNESNGESWLSEFEVKVNAPLPETGIIVIDDSFSGNGNGQLDPGESVTINIPALNSGHSNCSNSVMMLTTLSPYISIGQNSVSLGEIQAGESALAEFNVTVDDTAPTGTVVEFECELNMCEYLSQNSFFLNIGMIIEDFETGDFSAFDWQHDGSENWTITSENPYNGQYSTKSGPIGDNANSDLYIELTVINDDIITFARKVSSEATYDFLQFFIDGTKLGEWSGEADWDVVSYDIQAGQHTILWSYVKDMNTSSGSDCGWADDIVFPASTTIISINENTDVEGFSVYPNPGTGLYTININNKIASADVKVYNTLGSIIRSTKVDFTLGQSLLDLSEVGPGLYFIEIDTGKEKMIRKVVQK